MLDTQTAGGAGQVCVPKSGDNDGSCYGDPNFLGLMFQGDPVDVASGNMFYQVTDYETAGQNPLRFVRYYNSRVGTVGVLGANWTSNFTPYITYSSSPVQLTLIRGSGQIVPFTQPGSTWVADSDMDYQVTVSGSSYSFTDQDDTVETYSYNSSTGYGALSTRVFRNGYTQTMHYTSGVLTSVTDSYGRTLTFTYTNNVLTSVGTPDGTTISYGYTGSSAGRELTSVTYPTSPSTNVTYSYATSLPYNAMLSQVTDENGSNFLSWTYDAYGRALTSQRGTGSNAESFTFSYNDTAPSTTVTNALGVADTYSFTRLVNMKKVTSISRASTSTTAAATRSFTYDSNGFMASKTDWNGNSTTFTNTSHGNPTQIVEASGSAVARTTTVAYDPTWVHLPKTITRSGLTTGLTYDTSGEVLTKVLTDTTTTSSPYSTNGQARTWTNTWSNYLLATVKSPNGNTTTFGYNSGGALTSIKNALNQTTNITSVTTGGRPLTIVDPNGSTNGMTTTLAYDARQRLTSQAVASSAGTHTTTFTWDAASNLTKTTWPDNSYIAKTYDTAHRVTKVTDTLGEYTALTLDALGDVTQANIYDSGGTVWRKHSSTFDALGRMLTDVGGVSGETTTYIYDKNGNVTSTKDGNSNLLLTSYDALNRVKGHTNANASVMSIGYDAHDQVLSVNDYNGNTTSYVRDGFEDVIFQSSPDSGGTVYHYDSDGNMTQWIPAAGNGGNLAYDALDRITSKAFPAESSQNIYYTYDQPSGYPYSANEIGRLSYVLDAAGTTYFAYDTYGNVNQRIRVNSSYAIQNTTYASYDAANRPSNTSYPSGLNVSWFRDSDGNINQVAVIPPGSSSGQTLEYVAHDAFHGPVHYESFGNGVSDAISLDYDYRRTASQIFNSSNVNLSYQSYSYDSASNLTGVSDTVSASNNQTLTYDVLNRLTNAVSGTGGYGTLAWGYDSNGNLSSRTAGGVNYTYSYTPNTNRLASVTWPSNSETFGYTADGAINAMTLNGATAFSATYSILDRLETVSHTPTAISSMVYDGFGMRYSKTDSGGSPVTFVYDVQGHLIEENNNGTVKDYIYTDDKLAGIYLPATNTVYYVAGEIRDAPFIITDASQNVVWSTQYQPYGATTPTGTLTSNIRLPGQYYDSETTFSSNGFRDYVPTLGRYLEADPIGLQGGLNAYRYADANPFAAEDPIGLCPIEVNEDFEKILPTPRPTLPPGGTYDGDAPVTPVPGKKPGGGGGRTPSLPEL